MTLFRVVNDKADLESSNHNTDRPVGLILLRPSSAAVILRSVACRTLQSEKPRSRSKSARDSVPPVHFTHRLGTHLPGLGTTWRIGPFKHRIRVSTGPRYLDGPAPNRDLQPRRRGEDRLFAYHPAMLTRFGGAVTDDKRAAVRRDGRS